MASNYPTALDNLNEPTNPALTHGDIADAIEAIQSSLGVQFRNILPVGVIMPYAGTSSPSLWLPADGSTRARAAYPELFAICGTKFNTGGEAGTDFRLPNLEGRFPLGESGTYPEGTQGGAATVTLTVAQLPSHSHSIDHGHSASSDVQGSHSHTVSQGTAAAVAGGGSATIIDDQYHNEPTTTSGAHGHNITVNNHSGNSGSAGSGNSHENMPPFTAVEYIIFAGR